MNDPVAFFQRPFPSANAVLLRGERPVLVDGGFGADVPALVDWLHAQGTPPERLAMLVNTHFDCDHAGANHALAQTYGLPIAAHRTEAVMVNLRHPLSCRGFYLNQPVEPYRVDAPLEDGSVIDTDGACWVVVHTPGHTAGHISLHAPDAGLLVVGDVVHRDDVGWLDVTQPGMLDAAEDSVRRLSALRSIRAWSGHGPAMTDPPAALASAARRLAVWRDQPERMAWHGAKRVFAYALMVEDGVPEILIERYLRCSPWFVGYAEWFGSDPGSFARDLTAEMLRSGAAHWQGDLLTPSAPFIPPRQGWARAETDPSEWPR